MDSPFIERTVVITLSLILVAKVAAMRKGLFDPAVDHQQLLAIRVRPSRPSSAPLSVSWAAGW